MSLLAFVLAGLTSLIVVPALIKTLLQGDSTIENYRGRKVATPAGIAVVAATVVALVPLGAIDSLTGIDLLPAGLPTVALYCLGVALLGLIDDSLPNTSRGWRGHGTALLREGFSSGALKALGSLGLAFLAVGRGDRDVVDLAVAVLVLVLSTNLFNLLDLRPGRSIKTFLLFGGVVVVATRDWSALAAVAPLVAPVLVLFRYDLRELAMLGDTGSNMIGGMFGLLCIFALPFPGQIATLCLLVAVTVYAEVRSLSALIERVGPLRWLDSLGRSGSQPG